MTPARTNGRWTEVPLAELVLDATNGLASGERDPKGTLQVRMNNVGTDGSLDLINVIRIPVSSDQRSRYCLQADDVLFNNTNSTELVGKSTLFPGHDEPVLFSNHFTRLRTNRNRLHPSYLARWLTQQQQSQVFAHLCNRWVNQSAVRKEALLGLSIPLPPLPDQKRIAAILDQADAIRRKRRQTIQTATDLIPACFFDLFGDVCENTKDYPTRLLGEVAELDRGKSRNRPRDAAHLYGGPYPFIQTGDIANADGRILSYSQTYSEAGLAQSRLWPAGTLCITIAANIADTAILTFDACFPDSVVGLVPSRDLLVEYVQYWLVAMKKRIEDSATQVAQKNINLQLLRNLTIPLPPLAQQQRFAEALSEIRQLRDRQTRHWQESDGLFRSLTQRAFRGELQ